MKRFVFLPLKVGDGEIFAISDGPDMCRTVDPSSLVILADQAPDDVVDSARVVKHVPQEDLATLAL